MICIISVCFLVLFRQRKETALKLNLKSTGVKIMLSVNLMFSIMNAKKSAVSLNTFVARRAKVLNGAIRAYWYNYQCNILPLNSIIVKMAQNSSFLIVSNSCMTASRVLRVNAKYPIKHVKIFERIYNFNLITL